ncbi:hypothetical protein FB451DRAFT_1185142 [Mycena latifolia]|nr:hypothetical protein FB451DRAFT_1185142 [Mycena latifolia]
MPTASRPVSRSGIHQIRLLDDDCVAEICSYIVEDVVPDDLQNYATYSHLMGPFHRKWRVRRENHRRILALALTCKKFLDPALDVLWREADSLERFLNILPSFRKTACAWLAPPTPKHWARFDYYACRVYRFDYASRGLDSAITDIPQSKAYHCC